MSHCTKFEFSYVNEEAIAKAFGKMGLRPTTGLVSVFSSDFSKKVLSKIGYMGNQQFRAIYSQTAGGFSLFVCQIEEGSYKLLIERETISAGDEAVMTDLALRFQKAYISVAIDETIKRIGASGVPARVNEALQGFEIEFGPHYEYSIHVTFSGDEITEEVHGVKGDICTKLTEELEALLSSPAAELVTEWKPAYTVVHEEQTLQILSANF
ncbi:Protein of unknown function [Pseudomonas sp. Z003-0.4C(8344-21)]|uniref:DUF2997 domain-containing protein n=1 Tax=Pseudomonas sp. Z003-0.4C(8344-21) TaxID=1855380 RepID=UPI000879FC01|nr:DUF2997 domain-containing protein [Pseudomonas sp. Z003-0.4C(8344-21)]SDT15985.1 Protein of unknown function [Pseudomonas sp. Z003-0.4C(8344-21)]